MCYVRCITIHVRWWYNSHRAGTLRFMLLWHHSYLGCCSNIQATPYPLLALKSRVHHYSLSSSRWKSPCHHSLFVEDMLEHFLPIYVLDSVFSSLQCKVWGSDSGDWKILSSVLFFARLIVLYLTMPKCLKKNANHDAPCYAVFSSLSCFVFGSTYSP